MQKPSFKGNMKALEINDDNAFDISLSEASIPKEINTPHNIPCSKPLAKIPNSGGPVFPSNPKNEAVKRTCKPIQIKNNYNSSAITRTGNQSSQKTRACEGKTATEQCRFCQKQGLRKIISDNIYKKYEEKTQKAYNVNVVNDLILNSTSHIVAVFKDYLIYDDLAETLKHNYKSKEGTCKLKELTKNIEKSSKVYPNYILIEPKKLLFKNIQRKQKMINIKHAKEVKSNKKNEHKLFSQGFYEDLEERNSRILLHQMNIADLVDKFIAKDTISQINQSNCTSIEATFCNNQHQAIVKSGNKQENKAIHKTTKGQLMINIPQNTPLLNNFVSPARCHDQQKIGKLMSPQLNLLQSGRMSAAGNYATLSKKNIEAVQVNSCKSKPTVAIVKKLDQKLILKAIPGNSTPSTLAKKDALLIPGQPQTCMATVKNKATNPLVVGGQASRAKPVKPKTAYHPPMSKCNSIPTSNPILTFSPDNKKNQHNNKGGTKQIQKEQVKLPNKKLPQPKSGRTSAIPEMYKDKKFLEEGANHLSPKIIPAKGIKAKHDAKPSIQSPINMQMTKQVVQIKKMGDQKIRAGTAMGNIERTNNVKHNTIRKVTRMDKQIKK